MTQKIQCQTNTNTETQSVRVKIIKAPFVESSQLRRIIFERARALVL